MIYIKYLFKKQKIYKKLFISSPTSSLSNISFLSYDSNRRQESKHDILKTLFICRKGKNVTMRNESSTVPLNLQAHKIGMILITFNSYPFPFSHPFSNEKAVIQLTHPNSAQYKPATNDSYFISLGTSNFAQYNCNYI